ncbi:YkgJ family cysteine cluster protein [Archaeoglobus veneficus]|uniref:YkgJ family cysteine cluster protein n=1 Tax=Archaeoglobus veneficus (strain DSM 11195 / SNP6) TaxID=693661 RepID=F2KQT6_ARCVS|nr:YkgJ family cysteine cluster protein [Archaeoglobus veneficus]AEA46648.1 protein of unknown function UPF0153 [Archaeoglobus veneficus SNP6]
MYLSPLNLIPWKKIESWACVHCGKCCSSYDIPVTFEEEERLKKYGNVFKKAKIGLYLRKKKGKCVFWRKNRGCTIYAERPKACRSYPFYVRKEGEEDAYFDGFFIYIDAECRGINKGDPNSLLQWIKYAIEIKNS